MEIRERVGGMSFFEPKSEHEVRQYSPVTLAYIGDAVYETLVREYLIHEKSLPTYVLSRRAKQFVSAAAQSEIYDHISEQFTDEEADIFRRGRNSKASTVPKNTDVIVYKKATGFEAVIGFLYMTGRDERIREIFRMTFGYIEEKLRAREGRRKKL